MGNTGDMYDVIVIGGGCSGAGTARDCAMRGLRVLLVEKKDFSAGTTGACMGMIHGGLRYLLYDVPMTRASCIDSGYIQKIAPHLLFRIPFLTPVRKDSKLGMELYETFFECYDEFVEFKNGRKHTRLTPDEVRQIEPGVTADIAGAITTDEWGINPFRLCAANALSAAERGADVRNHTRVTAIHRAADTVTGVELLDEFTRRRETVSARIVLNVAGPWTTAVAALAGVEVKLRPGKGINLFFDRRLSNCAIVAETIDGRQVTLMPHDSSSMLGCTDDDYYGDLDDLTATRDEVEYLLQAVERIFPSVRKARVMRVMTGVRPTLFEWKPNEDKLSREYEIFDHETRDGLKGFISSAGGKLATYRLMSEHITDAICKKLGVAEKCRTHVEPLPGGESAIDVDAVAAEYNVPGYVVRRMFFRHGTRCRIILDMIRENPEWGEIVCACEPVTEAEIRYAVRNEWARTMDDVRRRASLGCGPCQGARCSLRAADIIGEELELQPDAAWRSTATFLQQRWKGKFPILRGDHLAQEELNQSIYFLAGGFADLPEIWE